MIGSMGRAGIPYSGISDGSVEVFVSPNPDKFQWAKWEV